MMHIWSRRTTRIVQEHAVDDVQLDVTEGLEQVTEYGLDLHESELPLAVFLPFLSASEPIDTFALFSPSFRPLPCFQAKFSEVTL